MTRTIVRPSGAAKETLWVMLLALTIVAVASAVAFVRVRTETTTALPAWQIDGRTDLNAAEQGINADLLVAAGEIGAMLSEGPAPRPAALAADAVPPFARDAASAQRGSHVWSLQTGSEGIAYLGSSGDPGASGSLLLRLETHDRANVRSSVWINRSPRAAVSGLADQSLIASGWKLVMGRFDGSVTRERH